MRSIILIFLFFIQASLAAADVYQYTDKDGIKHYTNYKKAIPAQYLEQLERTKSPTLVESLKDLISEESNVPSESKIFNSEKSKNNLIVTLKRNLPRSFLIPIHGPLKFDRPTKAEILKLRKNQVLKNKELLQGFYTPYSGVFALLEDNKAWWGTAGYFCHGAGPYSTDGPSFESLFLLNPYLLLAIEERVEHVARQESCVVAYPILSSLEWNLRDSRVIAIYNISEFMKNRSLTKAHLQQLVFDLINYNARDFGYEYIHAVPAVSFGIEPSPESKLFSMPCALNQSLQPIINCLPQETCMHHTPEQPELSFQIKRIPSQLYCKLWKEKPASIQDKPDLKFLIKFR